MNPAIGPISLPPLPRGVESIQGKTDQPSFKEFMLEAIDHVNSMQHDADQVVEHLMTGGDANVAEVMTAVQKADLSFRMMMQLRNKLVQAYQEIKEIRI